MNLIQVESGDQLSPFINVWLDDVNVSGKCVWALIPDTPGIEGKGKVKLIKGYKDDEIEVELKEGIVRWQYART
jgi:hypothetical protein